MKTRIDLHLNHDFFLEEHMLAILSQRFGDIRDVLPGELRILLTDYAGHAVTSECGGERDLIFVLFPLGEVKPVPSEKGIIFPCTSADFVSTFHHALDRWLERN